MATKLRTATPAANLQPLKTVWIRRDFNSSLIVEVVGYNPHNENYEEVQVTRVPGDASNGYYEVEGNEFKRNEVAYLEYLKRTAPDTSIQELILQLGEAQAAIFESQLYIMSMLEPTPVKEPEVKEETNITE